MTDDTNKLAAALTAWRALGEWERTTAMYALAVCREVHSDKAEHRHFDVAIALLSAAGEVDHDQEA